MDDTEDPDDDALTALLSALAEPELEPPPEPEIDAPLGAALERILITRERLKKGRFKGGWVVELETLLVAAEEVAGRLIRLWRDLDTQGFPVLTDEQNARLDQMITEGGGFMDEEPRGEKPKRQVDIVGRIDHEQAAASIPAFAEAARKQLEQRDAILARRRDRTPEEKAEVARMLAEAQAKLPPPGGGMKP